MLFQNLFFQAYVYTICNISTSKVNFHKNILLIFLHN